jgi:hypothetical protein
MKPLEAMKGKTLMCSLLTGSTAIVRLTLSAAIVISAIAAGNAADNGVSKGADSSSESEGWKPLFDGKTLDGWHPVGDGTWTAEKGVIVGRANKEKLYGLLFSDDEFSDFTVRFKFKVLAGDSGFYIRTVFKEPDQAHGNQVQVGLRGSGVGGVYESYGRGWVEKPSDELQARILRDRDWNDMVISAHGGDIVVHVNGTKTADIKNDPGRRKGHFALQMHSGNVMHLMFKDIEVK